LVSVKVVLADVNVDGAKEVAAKIAGDGHTAIGQALDVTSTDSVAEMVERARAAFGGIDILVNVAALMAQLPQAALVDYPLDWWDRAFRVNLTGPFLCVRGVVPSMIERGGGKIVNIASGSAFLGHSTYGVSKLSLVGLTVALAEELGVHNINVNAIAPGMVNTEAGFRSAPKDHPYRVAHAERVALRPFGDPEDLVGALMLLTTSAGDWMTGQTLNVDGGWIMRI
jgi:NAD(P)-dependent dehydrogenase (short-subunit alcohol dehydrogenase family)